jgi:hypothetical protein
MTATDSHSNIFSQIASGDFDEDFDNVFQALRERERYVRSLKASQALGTLQPGDTVRFNNEARPKYLQGGLATVERLNSTRVVITLITDHGSRYRQGMSLPCPPDILEKVDSNDETPRAIIVPIQPTFTPNDEVCFTSNVRPGYLAGVKAKVVRLNPRNIVICLNEPHGRYQGEMSCPPELLEKIEPV